jgi:hypothetical protein
METAAGSLSSDSTSAAADFYRRASAAGVPYDTMPLDGGLSYTRPWLWAAYNQDSLGVTGREAFLTLLSQGWSTRAACRDGSDLYAMVIEHGEAALGRGWNDPTIHANVARAYHDIVTMALGAEETGYIDSTQCTARLPSARLNAVAHYRAALEGVQEPARSTRALASGNGSAALTPNKYTAILLHL